jgi:hypothetical protein
MLLAVAVISFAGIALSAGGGGSKVTFCAQKTGGELSLGKNGRCSRGEKKVTIAKQGPAGETGPAGADGAPADVAPEAVRHVSGPAISACDQQPGTFCDPPGGIPGWDNYGGPWREVGYQKDAGGFVHLSGTTVESGSGVFGAAIIFYLPPGYRPTDGNLRFANPFPNSPPGETIEVRSDGAVYSSIDYATLDGIVFHP